MRPALLHEILTASGRLNSRVPRSRANHVKRCICKQFARASVRTWIQIHEQQLTSDADCHFFILLRERHFNLIKTKTLITKSSPIWDLRGPWEKVYTLCPKSRAMGRFILYKRARWPSRIVWMAMNFGDKNLILVTYDHREKQQPLSQSASEKSSTQSRFIHVHHSIEIFCVLCWRGKRYIVRYWAKSKISWEIKHLL